MSNRGSRNPSRGNRAGGGSRAPAQIFQSDIPAHIDSRINSSDQLVKEFKKLAITKERPLRPGYGKLGRPITLRANFFAVRVPNVPIYDYSVDITPKTDLRSQPMRSRIFQLLERSEQIAPHLGHIAHDNGGRIISARPLVQPLSVEITYSEEGESPRPDGKVFMIEIAFIRQMDMTELTK
jgi:eukaryotic translation initiation factor 2C